MMQRAVALSLLVLALAGCRSAKGDEFHPLDPARDLPPAATTAPAPGSNHDDNIWDAQKCPGQKGQWSPHHVFQCKPIGWGSDILTWQR